MPHLPVQPKSIKNNNNNNNNNNRIRRWKIAGLSRESHDAYMPSRMSYVVEDPIGPRIDTVTHLGSSGVGTGSKGERVDELQVVM